MAKQFLDYAGLQAFWTKIKEFVAANYVAKVDGKGLSTNDFTNDDKSKLAGIESGAQVNVITGIKMEGAADNLTPTPSDKIVTIPVDNSLSSTSINPIQNKVVYTAIATLASAVDKSVQSVEGDAYVSASLSDVGDGSQDGQKLTIAATSDLKNAITTAKNALQKADIVSGTSNGTISVGGEDVAVKGLGSAAYTESGSYAPASLSTQVNNNTDDIKDLKSTVAGLAAATRFLGITTTELIDDSTTSTIQIDGKDVKAQKGDVVIYGNSEFIWTDSKWEKLGDTTAEAQRIANIEKSYVSSFGGAKGAITIDDAATAVGAVDFAISDNKLTGTVNVGTTSFGGKTGAITVNSGSTTAGDVNFAMSDNKLTGKVVLPNLINGITVADSTTIDMTLDTTTTPGTPNIIASAKTGAVASDAATLTTGGQVYTYVTNVVNGLDSPSRVDSTASNIADDLKLVQVDADTTATAVSKSFEVVANAVQTNGKVSASAVTIGPIPISAITALL